MELTHQEGKHLKVAHLNIPAKPKERPSSCETTIYEYPREVTDICRMNANCMPDKRINMNKSSSTTTPNSYLHAINLEDQLAE